MKKLITTMALMLSTSFAYATEIASVDTAFQLFGPNHQVIIERFDDPDVENASCFVSYAKTGGFGSNFGFTEDPSRFSIACRATGPVTITGDVPETMTEIFRRNSSVFFKNMRVSRMIDTETNVLVYLVWSTKLIDGSPYNAITAIAIDN